MKNALILTLSMFMLATTFGQTNQPKYITEALKVYESGKYFEAMPKLEAAYNKMTNKGKGQFKK